MARPNLNRIENRYAVTRKGAKEAIRQTLYDFQTYNAAGHSTLSFFQTPVGQSGKTFEDTNMEAAGQLPNPKSFLVTGIEIQFFPGVNPAVSGANVAQARAFINDIYTIMKRGYLDFFISSKSYLTEGPLGKFPPKIFMSGFSGSSDTTTAGANQAFTLAYGSMAGMPYRLNPHIMLESNQNFNVTLNWPAGVAALPSTVNGRIGVILDGILYRASQ